MAVKIDRNRAADIQTLAYRLHTKAELFRNMAFQNYGPDADYEPDPEIDMQLDFLIADMQKEISRAKKLIRR